MTGTLKLKRSQFAFLMATVGAAEFYLVQLIPSMPVQGFTVAVLNALLIYLATEEKADSGGGGTPG